MFFQSRCRRHYPGGRDLCLALKKHSRTRGEMGGFPTSREPTNRCYNCRPAPGDRLFLARLDRGVQSRPLVCSDALDRTNWLWSQLDVRFIAGEFSVIARRPIVYSVCRTTWQARIGELLSLCSVSEF